MNLQLVLVIFISFLYAARSMRYDDDLIIEANDITMTADGNGSAEYVLQDNEVICINISRGEYFHVKMTPVFGMYIITETCFGHVRIYASPSEKLPIESNHFLEIPANEVYPFNPALMGASASLGILGAEETSMVKLKMATSLEERFYEFPPIGNSGNIELTYVGRDSLDIRFYPVNTYFVLDEKTLSFNYTLYLIENRKGITTSTLSGLEEAFRQSGGNGKKFEFSHSVSVEKFSKYVTHLRQDIEYVICVVVVNEHALEYKVYHPMVTRLMHVRSIPMDDVITDTVLARGFVYYQVMVRREVERMEIEVSSVNPQTEEDDADLYISFNSFPPTYAQYDIAQIRPGDDRVVITHPKLGMTVFIGVYGFKRTVYELTVRSVE